MLLGEKNRKGNINPASSVIKEGGGGLQIASETDAMSPWTLHMYTMVSCNAVEKNPNAERKGRESAMQ